MVTGAVSGLVILDFDGVAGEQLRQRLGIPIHVRTRSGGAHVYCEHPGWKVATLNSKATRELGRQWPGLDIRADGGYAVMPPTEMDTGSYHWEVDPQQLELLSLFTLPTDLRDFLGLSQPPQVIKPAPRSVPSSASRRTYDERTLAEVLIRRALEKVEDGEGRNNAGAWLAAQLRDNGYSQQEAGHHMENYAMQCPLTDAHGQHDPYTAAEARKTVTSIFSRPPREPWSGERGNRETPRPVQSSSVRVDQDEELLALPAEMRGPVVVAGEQAFRAVEGALKLPSAANAEVRSALTAEELRNLVQSERVVYVLTPTQAVARALDACGVEWYALPAMPLEATPEELLAALQDAMTDALPIGGNMAFLEEELLKIAEARLRRGGNTYPTGLSEFDEAVGGGFYDGLHVLGGVTGGGKTALALAIAQHNAEQGRPILYVTYEQSRYELWGRVISAKVGVGLRQLRTGGTVESPVATQLRENPAYQELTRRVGPYLSVAEGNGVDGGAWGVDRIAAQVKRLKSAYGVSPLVILDYLQRMPAGEVKDRRHQIDEVVMALQVRLGRELNTPILLISSVGRGNYGELLTAPLEARLSVFKESGGVEYTAYTASLLYPLGANDAQSLNLEPAPAPGSSRAALRGLWKYLVLDLVKNREGEAPRQWVVKWYPVRGIFELVQSVDTDALESSTNGRRGGRI